MDSVAARLAEKWARIIAAAYAAQARAPLTASHQDPLAEQLSSRLTVAITSGGEWSTHVNLVLNAWERRRRGEGPRLLSLDKLAGTVEMGHRPAGKR